MFHIGDCNGGRGLGSRQYPTNFNKDTKSYWEMNYPRAMFCPYMIRERVNEDSLIRSEYNQRWERPYDMLVEATRGEIII